MLKDVTSVKALKGFRLRVRFEDGAEGAADISKLVGFKGVFAPLKNKSEFRKVRVNKELGTVEWPCGADLDPDVLYAAITDSEIPDYSDSIKAG